jgi:hypothetical protein
VETIMTIVTRSSIRPAAAVLAIALFAPVQAGAWQSGAASAPPQVPESAGAAADTPFASIGRDLEASLAALSAELQGMHSRQQAHQRADGQPRDQRRSQTDSLYEAARQAIERAQWSLAVQQFTTLAQTRGPRADAAMYWRAYALDKMNRHADALAAVADLFKRFPASRWVGDARALELQVRQRSGRAVPVDAADDELKLLALQGLQQTAPDRALPLIVKVINDVASIRVKERALFVLAQSAAPEARATLEKVARGDANPELQVKAVQYIAMSGQPGRAAVLNDIYAAVSDVEIKRQVLRAFTMTGDRQRVLTAALTEKAPELRAEAVRQLGLLGARDELWQMYQKETAVDVKRNVLSALAMSGSGPRLLEVIATERAPELRAEAIRHFGMVGGRTAADALVTQYGKESDISVRRAIIDALSFHANADVLVSLARKETNPELRRDLVRRLSMTGAPAAIEYLTEILNK